MTDAAPSPAFIDDEAALRALYGPAAPRSVAKQIDRLDAHCLAFLARSPMLFMATSDGMRADVSPKGDAPGFVQADGDRHILIPDRPGNRRIDGLSNILRNPQVGLIFVMPGEGWTLRINGSARICIDPAVLARFEIGGKTPISVLRVTCEEVFLHCPKAFMRSNLWSPDSWAAPEERPVIAQVLAAHAELAEVPDSDELEASQRATLY
jgi:PPOX class probable FMN-dependent enzyme